MIRNRATLSTIAISALAMFAVGCSDDAPTPPTETTAYGTSKTIAGGSVRSFVKSDASGNPMEIGLRISETTVNGMPALPGATPMEHMYDIALPATASKTAFQHVSLDWNAIGHPPTGVYDTAHFDMHFYTVPMADRMTWSAQGADSARMVTRPDASLVPTNYITDGHAIPYMGMHFVDPTSGEWGTSKFNSTFIWGFYNGQQAFLEPMITQWFLQSKAQHTQTLKLPTNYSRPGMYYPTTYTVAFDNVNKEHVITMGGMTKR